MRKDALALGDVVLDPLQVFFVNGIYLGITSY